MTHTLTTRRAASTVLPTLRSIPRLTLADQVMVQLREEIIAGKLAPGTMVAEIPTAVRLGVSRVPVREATLALEREGLLVFEPSGRCRVRSLDARDFEEIYEIRLLLECEVFRLAAIRRTDAQIAILERNIAQMERAKSIAKVSLLDIEFHELMLQAADNSRLTRLWEIMRGQIQLFTASLQRQANDLTADVRETSVEGHRECLSIIISRDSERAADTARRHLETWRKWLLTNNCEGLR